MSLIPEYDLEDFEDRPKRRETKPYHPHDFRFNRDTRRMVCENCHGIMNEAPAECPGPTPLGI